MIRAEELCGCCEREDDWPSYAPIGFMDVPVCSSCSYHRSLVVAGEMICPLRVVA